MDLVRTFPGAQADYLRNVEANWASARELASTGGDVISFVALAAPPDSGRGWDIVLLTEYADSTAYENREEIFAEIFGSDAFQPVDVGRPTSELRTFFASEVSLRTVAASF